MEACFVTGGGWNGVLRGRCGGGIPVVSKGRFVGCCVLSVSKGGEGGRRKRSFVVVKATASTASTEVQSESNSSATGEAFGLNRLLDHGKSRRFVFVSGKGGVGKTTSSASIAVKLADEGFRTLVLSTDPAHSLGDCLDMDLASGEVVPVTENLFALECDTKEAVKELQEKLAKLKDLTPGGGKDGGKGDGQAAKELADQLGLGEFGEVLSTLPPGADEFVALARVLRLAEDADEGYERIVIDTAPTGHTLRLLAFPDFLDNFLEKATALRQRLDSARAAINSVSSLLGTSAFSEESLQKAAAEVDAYRLRMSELSALLRDPGQTEFVVVSIATKLSTMESKRLLMSLFEEGIWVRNLIINQLVTEEMSETYLGHVVEGQQRNLRRAEKSFPNLAITKVPRFDMEVRGVYGLRSFAQVAFPESLLEERWNDLFTPGALEATKDRFVFVGGKGGVGKTSTSAAMGVKLADKGNKTLIISTDPAHSLSDALDVHLTGDPTPIEGTEGNLYAMEIDTERAVEEFKTLVRDFVEKGAGFGADLARRFGIDEFSSILENTPPGIDELVALTQVVKLVKSGQFQRVVVDTAPTGHTLRLLSFPEFLNSFLGKILRLKRRIDSLISSVKNIFGKDNSTDGIDNAARKVEEFRTNMTDLKLMLEDSKRTQFCVVTIPTDLAMAESERLVASLQKDRVVVNNMIVNQIIPEHATASYMKRRFKEQNQCLKQLEALSEIDGLPLAIIKVNYFDEEVRGLDRLRNMTTSLFETVSDTEIAIPKREE